MSRISIGKKKELRGRLIISACILGIFTILLTAVAIFVYNPAYIYRTVKQISDQDSIRVLSDQSSGQIQSSVDNNRFNELLNNFGNDMAVFVLLGFDRTEERDRIYSLYRPDTIMIACINLHTTEISLMNIPRDSYVIIDGVDKYDKINHSYMYGYRLAGTNDDPHKNGIDTTLRTISKFLGGIPIDGYLALDMDDSTAIIDSIGGIHYDVDIDSNLKQNDQIIYIEKGYQLLSGEEVMVYIRERNSMFGGERGRTERQQQIVIAFYNQLKKGGFLKNIPAFYQSIRRNIETDLKLAQLVSLAFLSLKVDTDNVKTYVFSGKGQLLNTNGQNIYYLFIDEDERAKVIEEVLGIIINE